MTEATALLAVIWAIVATLVAARALAKLGRTVNGYVAALVEITRANERADVAIALNDRWEELYGDLIRKMIATGQPYMVSDPVTPPGDLVN